MFPMSNADAKSKLKLNKSSITMIGGTGFVKLKVKGLKKGQKAVFTSKNEKVAYLTTENSKKGYVFIRADNPGKTKVIAKIGSKKLICKIKVTNPFKGVKFVIPNLIKNFESGNDYGARYAISNARFYNDDGFYKLRFNVTLIKEETNSHSSANDRNRFCTYVALLDKNNNVLNSNAGYPNVTGWANITLEESDKTGEAFSLGETKEAEVSIYENEKVFGKVKTVVFMENPVYPCAYTGKKLPNTAFSNSNNPDATSTPTPTPTGKQLTKLYYENSSYTWNHDAIPRTVWQPTECDGNGIHPFAIMYSSADGSRFTYGDYTYKSSNTSVATIDGNGAVTFVGYGTTILTCSYGTLSSSMTLTITGGGVGTPTPTPYVTPTPTPDAHQHKDCTYCSGKGKIKCATCNGKGQVHYPCTRCNSTGYYTYMDGTKEVCNSCRLKMVTCMDCLGGNGIVTCKYCEGTGEYSSVCFNCKGEKRYLCRNCKGLKNIRCRTCGGTGRFSYYDSIHHVTGWADCKTCGGKGNIYCQQCDNDGITVCPECNGTGKQ